MSKRKNGLKGRRLDAKARAARRASRAAKRAGAAMVGLEDVAKALGRGRNQVLGDIAAGEIPGKRFGRVWRVPRVWLDRVCSGETVTSS